MDCGNCPLDKSILGCNLGQDECDIFASLVELSWDRALKNKETFNSSKHIINVEVE